MNWQSSRNWDELRRPGKRGIIFTSCAPASPSRTSCGPIGVSSTQIRKAPAMSRLFVKPVLKKATIARWKSYRTARCGRSGHGTPEKLARRLRRGVMVNPDRYHRSACHLTRQTVELRVFQGWFNLNHVLACIDLAESTFEFSQQVPLSKLNQRFAGKYSDWLQMQPRWKYAKEAIQCV